MDNLNKYKNGSELNWRDVELCLYVLYCYGEALPKAAMVFVNPDDTLSPLGDLVAEMVLSSMIKEDLIDDILTFLNRYFCLSSSFHCNAIF